MQVPLPDGWEWPGLGVSGLVALTLVFKAVRLGVLWLARGGVGAAAGPAAGPPAPDAAGAILTQPRAVQAPPESAEGNLQLARGALVDVIADGVEQGLRRCHFRPPP